MKDAKSVATPVDASTKLKVERRLIRVYINRLRAAYSICQEEQDQTLHSLYVVWPSSAHSPQSVIGQLLSVYFAT